MGMALALVCIGAYLLGSIPFGLILGRLAGKDVRRLGSCNIGATNVWRVCGRWWGLAAFVLDFAKGLGAVTLLPGLFGAAGAGLWGGILAAAGAVVGHNFPVWLRFRGGKGVATSAGAVAGLMWLPFAIAMAVFVLTVAVSHYISLGSMLASVALVASVILLVPGSLSANAPLTLLAALLSVMVIVRHRANIARIRAGSENRFPPKR